MTETNPNPVPVAPPAQPAVVLSVGALSEDVVSAAVTKIKGDVVAAVKGAAKSLGISVGWLLAGAAAAIAVMHYAL